MRIVRAVFSAASFCQWCAWRLGAGLFTSAASRGADGHVAVSYGWSESTYTARLADVRLDGFLFSPTVNEGAPLAVRRALGPRGDGVHTVASTAAASVDLLDAAGRWHAFQPGDVLEHPRRRRAAAPEPW